MKSSILLRQINDAKTNYNYFYTIMITKVAKKIIALVCILLLNQIIDTLFINIISLLYLFYSIFSIYKVVDEYSYIIKDIKNTFKNDEFTYIIDLSNIKETLYKGVVKYGK